MKPGYPYTTVYITPPSNTILGSKNIPPGVASTSRGGMYNVLRDKWDGCFEFDNMYQVPLSEVVYSTAFNAFPKYCLEYSMENGEDHLAHVRFQSYEKTTIENYPKNYVRS